MIKLQKADACLRKIMAKLMIEHLSLRFIKYSLDFIEVYLLFPRNHFLAVFFPLDDHYWPNVVHEIKSNETQSVNTIPFHFCDEATPWFKMR